VAGAALVIRIGHISGGSGDGTPRGAHDLIIAATARATSRTVVTSDRTGFIDLPGVNVRRPV
jgi:predicted nucleic acid-binding protein